jgi:hypothetical protein
LRQEKEKKNKIKTGRFIMAELVFSSTKKGKINSPSLFGLKEERKKVIPHQV